MFTLNLNIFYLMPFTFNDITFVEMYYCDGISTEVKVYVDHILILVHITLTLIDITYCNLHHYRTTCGLLSISL